MASEPDPLDDGDDGRDESPNERSDRNWSDLMQELRVLQTGTQILTGFLLTLPFQARFPQIGTFDHVLYLVLLVLAVTVSVLALAPVMMHRLLFGTRVKPALVRVSGRILVACLVATSVLVIGIVQFVFDIVASPQLGMLAAGVVTAIVLALWIVGPRVVRSAQRRMTP
ncbi:sodium:proton antiporter [Pseudoclavibacter chungangensis]|uniref:Sodium:proton antiporter n=1 Tax=Pseudoclavibacter chungangensis TaxID=587635 RepID=A0A7J5BZJ6_9MICO|nr:DUF6328 family protein [Pseudoclavibacter chungangensis]KAB1660038.1 sodium:proton antiporter [Pseudoclavibacter chungangensis]NYJ66870.1 hypothetical protein [Pseudoclavibacter chungangensis]